MTIHLSRRKLLANATAAAFVFGFRLSPASVRETGDTGEINAWLSIHPDERTIIRISRAEMGQGSMTGLAQLLADELDCDWKQVAIEFARPGNSRARGNIYGNFQTGGSGSIRELHQTMRQAGATARKMLVSAAAEGWRVSANECTTSNGRVIHRATNRSISYGQVANKAAGIAPDSAAPLKDPKSWTLIGKPLPRLEAAEKVTGKAKFGIDVTLPGMLSAAVRMCPYAGGTVGSFTPEKISAMPGVKRIVQIDDRTIAVIAERWWQAESAISVLPIVWKEGPNSNVSSASIGAMLEQGLDAEDSYTGTNVGDAKGALASAAKTITATYAFPYQSHSPLEPMNATALWTSERCEVWAPTQSAGNMLELIAKASGLTEDQCEVYPTYLGGGFGRRLYSDFAALAVAIARSMPGTPIKMIWSRAEDMTHDFYHPTTRARLTGGLDAGGKLTALHVRVSGQSIRAVHAPRLLRGNGDPHMLNGLNNSNFSYSGENFLVDLAMRNPPIPPGAWRAVHANQNFFYVESFVDELAHAADTDPLAFRRSLLTGNPRLLAVLEAAAQRIGWPKSAQGSGKGLACAYVTDSYVAAAAEVSMKDGKLKISRMTCAIDCGTAANPALISRQLEGGLAFGLSAALFGECTVERGAIQETNFDSYEIIRMNDMPPIETIIMPSGGFWGGVGEPPVVVAGPAVMNAIFAATGKRIRTLPLKNHDLTVK